MAFREGAIDATGAMVESGETDGPQVTVVVHPLVLLSVVDHYSRVAKDTKKRVAHDGAPQVLQVVAPAPPPAGLKKISRPS